MIDAWGIPHRWEDASGVTRDVDPAQVTVDEAMTSVHVVNLATGLEEPSIATAGGFGLAISPDGAQLYLARGDAVQIVDRATGALLRTVSVTGSARRIAFASNGVALVTNESGWVDFIE